MGVRKLECKGGDRDKLGLNKIQWRVLLSVAMTVQDH
jgi:hypothetical protein